MSPTSRRDRVDLLKVRAALPPPDGEVVDAYERHLRSERGLSPHTVHDYVKALYRHFGVQSRAELLALCLARGG